MFLGLGFFAMMKCLGSRNSVPRFSARADLHGISSKEEDAPAVQQALDLQQMLERMERMEALQKSMADKIEALYAGKGKDRIESASQNPLADTSKEATPPPSNMAEQLRQFIGHDKDGNACIYIGEEFSCAAVKFPACILVGKNAAVTWKPRDHVNVTFGETLLTGVVLWSPKRWPWVCYLEIIEGDARRLGEPPLCPFKKNGLDVIILPGNVPAKLEMWTDYPNSHGKASGPVEAGNVLAKWERESGLLAGVVLEVGDDKTFECLQFVPAGLKIFEDSSKGAWYWKEYPEREPTRVYKWN